MLPPPAPADDDWSAVDGMLDDFVRHGAFPGGVLAAGDLHGPVHVHAFGRLTDARDSPQATPETLYDLASLTKVVATTTMAMMLVDEGRLRLDDPVARWLPEFHGGGRDRVTVRHLLTHSSGLAAWAPVHRQVQGKAAFYECLTGLDLEYEPGTRSVYSDLGIMLLGEVLERAAGETLDGFVGRRVLAPLGLVDTLFCPEQGLLPRIAPTEDDPTRGGVLRGTVHDENAYAQGGIAAHAGLFGSAPDLARFAQMMLNGGTYEGRPLVRAETIELFTRRAGVPESSRALGWDTPSGESTGGTLLSARAFGHTGFTGTSLWIDPAQGLYVVLLTNRVHPTRENESIREARPAVMDAAVCALETRRVKVGLDVVARDKGGPLRGKRVGLVVHAASVDAQGRHAVDVLRDSGVDVVRLFAPEHGLRGRAAAGEAIATSKDASGLPVVSLYGDKTKPTRADLAGLDALVFDLQDAGVRFYTYMSTLLLCLDAAAESGVPLVVLDRPNPLGGERLAGPRRDTRPTFLSLAPGPLLHGLTVGEMARYVNAHRDRPAALTVVPMEGWRRRMTWVDTGRAWVPPSPNLRSPEAALAYPGTCLLEATNVSEGRGTDAPFLLIGAPWLEATTLADAMRAPGFALREARFTPRAHAGSGDPKWRDQECAGVRVHVTDTRAADPYAFGLRLLTTLLHANPHVRLREDGAALDRLLGTTRPRRALRRGDPVDEILRADAADLEAWRHERRAALLYD